MNALEYAIGMELDGERFYAEQASLHQKSSAGVVCCLLAEAERAHERLLREKSACMAAALPEKDSFINSQSVFKEASDLKSEIRETPNQLEFYRIALELEQKSVELYEKLLAETEDQDEKALFLYLIEQEKSHTALLDELATMLRHAEEWVESAEFGLRKETY